MASEEVLFALIRTKRLPVLLYGTEVSLTNSAIIQSLQFTLNKVFFNCLAPCLKNVTRKSVTTLVLVLLKK